MIPKKIHYIWFGEKPLPPLAKNCIASWRKYMPDFEIIRWDESNFDIRSCNYVREAYEAKKWAFVSDYARFKILYEHGGVYLDTDVELVRSLDPILEQGPYMGFEVDYREEDQGQVSAGLGMAVNPGLGMAVNPGLGLFKTILDSYEKDNFILPDGSQDLTTVVTRVTTILKTLGLRDMPGIQDVAGVRIYPTEYFCPKHPLTLRLSLTKNSYSIHHYDGSWTTGKEKFHKRVSYLIGPKATAVAKKLLGR